VSLGTRSNAVLRAGILRAADDRHVRRFMGRYGMRLGAGRFVAGETLDDCVVVLRRLAAQGLHANTTLLGESVRDPGEAEAVAGEYGRILERLHGEQLPVNVALKLTHLGLELDEELAYANVERVVQVAERLQSFVRIDMEQSSVVDATLRIYRRLREAGHDRVGTVLQSYLYRTASDLEALLPLAPNLRFVKGAYLEPPEIAYTAKADVDAAYGRLVETALRGGAYAAIATHDETLIGRCLAFAEREGIPRDRFELQMLYGVRPGLQLDYVGAGYKVLVATPYGPEWYPYLMRRLAERPANLGFFVRNFVRR
jgi:proline dehydrogenase